jgi:hypothetical protein
MAEKDPSLKLQNPMADALCDLTAWLEGEQIPHAVIGGVAVSLLAQPRVTDDLDAVIACDTDLLESLLQKGAPHGFVPRISDAADFARRNQVILLQHQPTGINVDLSCGTLPFDQEMIARARKLTIGTVNIRVITPEDLIITKAVAHRPRDIADIEAILNIEPNLDFDRIRSWVGKFAETLEMPELLEDLEKLLSR